MRAVLDAIQHCRTVFWVWKTPSTFICVSMTRPELRNRQLSARAEGYSCIALYEDPISANTSCILYIDSLLSAARKRWRLRRLNRSNSRWRRTSFWRGFSGLSILLEIPKCQWHYLAAPSHYNSERRQDAHKLASISRTMQITTPAWLPMEVIPFSAFWLRSSVVSVLIRLKSDRPGTCPARF